MSFERHFISETLIFYLARHNVAPYTWDKRDNLWKWTTMKKLDNATNVICSSKHFNGRKIITYDREFKFILKNKKIYKTNRSISRMTAPNVCLSSNICLWWWSLFFFLRNILCKCYDVYVCVCNVTYVSFS